MNLGSLKMRSLVWVLPTILAMWLGPVMLVACFEPKWEVRGLIGDSFGVAGSFFATLNFLVVVAALLGQQRDFAEQLREMRDARVLADKPLIIAQASGYCAVRRPKPRREGERVVNSTELVFEFAVQNFGRDPALAVEFTARLEWPQRDKVDARPISHITVLPYSPASVDAERRDVNVEVLTEDLNSLVANHAARTCILVLYIAYKNASGAQFESVHRFAVTPFDEANGQVLSTLVGSWSGDPIEGAVTVGADDGEPRLKLTLIEDGFSLVTAKPSITSIV